MTIVERIRRKGAIPVAVYMDAVAEAYYAQGNAFGAAGDFITAPEISQAFGELIGLWCAVVWQNMGSPARFRLTECGPGRGTLMQDLLRAAGRVPGFTAAAEIHLIERSAALREKQRAALKDSVVTWHDTIDSVPTGPMVLVANEFLDALPIHQFEMTAHGWMERFVGLDDAGALTFVLKPGVPSDPPPATAGDIFETSLAVRDFAAKISKRLARDGGAALLIDYGHTKTSIGETLQAVRKHRPCGVFETPGEADLTAHVDFAAALAAAKGVTTFGPVAQGAWLNRLGIKLRGVQLAQGKSAEAAGAIASGIRRLTEPDAMGVLFKVAALAHPSLATLEGFQQDAAP